MVTVELIQERLALLGEYVEDLRAQQSISFTEYVNNKIIRRFIEHTLQIAVESCLDIGHHIIAEKHLPLPKERREIFSVLSQAGIISSKPLPALHKATGFRNRLVHEYEKIENELVYGILKKNLSDFDEFRLAIYQFLDKEIQTSAKESPGLGDSSGTTLREPRAPYRVPHKRKTKK